MLLLIVATFFSASFGLVVRYAQRRACNLWAVGALNYVTAALLHTLRHLLISSSPPSTPTWLIGGLGGIAYATSYLLFFPLMALRGVSVSTAIVRLSAVIPIAVSVVVWGERPDGAQTTGALLALLSLPLLGFGTNRNREAFPRAAVGLLVALFAGNGLCMLAVTAYKQSGVLGQESAFLAVLFGMAAVVAISAWLLRRDGTLPKDVLPGITLGLCNAVGNIALVLALQELPSAIVFPFQAATGLMYAALFARLAWGERITRLETAGMAVALAAVALINAG